MCFEQNSSSLEHHQPTQQQIAMTLLQNDAPVSLKLGQRVLRNCLFYYMLTISKKETIISHFRVALSLFIEVRPAAQSKV